jgi:hypothetical protein
MALNNYQQQIFNINTCNKLSEVCLGTTLTNVTEFHNKIRKNSVISSYSEFETYYPINFPKG